MASPGSSGSDFAIVGGDGGASALPQSKRETDDAPTLGADRDGPLGPDRFDPYTLIGQKVGRYVVLDVIGSGGMGVVCTAFDPKLDRKVALKLLKNPSRATPEKISRARARMVREAQALAKLSHPNIIVVHDVDNWNHRLFMAMEYVKGCDLAQWLKRKERPYKEILDIFTRAGRGLMAAHKAGITHRDFKPSNVLVGEDGRVRVLDFGLAKTFERTGSEMEADAPGPRGPRLRDVSSDISEDGPANDASPRSEVDSDIMAVVGSATAMKLTQAGRLLGTPAYMAPEAHGTENEVGPWSDQFSFCVSLYESLYGYVPFRGHYLQEVLEEVKADRIREPKDTAVPGWILRVLRRGLAYEPDARYPSMDALLDELGRDPATKRRRILRGVGLGSLGVLAAFGLVKALDGDEPCQGARARAQEVWNEGRRAEIGQALRATRTPYADDTAERVVAALDRYTDAWAEQRSRVCEATHIHREQSEALLDHRMRCLDEHLSELQAVVRVLAEADEKVVLRATSAVTGLGSPEPCATAQPAGEDPLPEDPDRRAAILDVRTGLDRAKALLDFAARYEDAARLLDQAVQSAEALDHQPTLAEALFMRGQAQRELGRLDLSESSFQRAATAAAAAGSTTTEARAWIELVSTSGVRRGDQSRAEAWASAARAALERTTDREGLELDLLMNVGAAQLKANALEDAAETHARALELSTRNSGGPTQVAKLRTNAGIVAAKRGLYPEAQEHLDAAYRLKLEIYGPSHPDVARTALSLGNVFAVQDATPETLERAEHYYREALSIRQRVYGAASVPVAQVHVSLGKLAELRRNTAEAEKAFGRAAAVFRTTPDQAGQLAVVLNNLGTLASARGDTEAALAAHREALSTLVAIEGENSPSVAHTRHLLCQAQAKGGDFAAARESCAAAVATFEATQSNLAAGVLRDWAFLERNAGNHTAAASLAMRALELGKDEGDLSPNAVEQLRSLSAN